MNEGAENATQWMHSSLIDAHMQIAELLRISNFKVEDRTSHLSNSLVITPRSKVNLGSLYYKNLHDNESSYQNNNWLLERAEEILKCFSVETIAEVGCGNGHFSRFITKVAKEVYALDWVRAPGMKSVADNLHFIEGDIRSIDIPKVELLCSADVLEHFSVEDLPPLVARLTAAAKHQYHVIACYDDGHSHLTIMQPSAWLALFWRFSPKAKIVDISCRRNDPRQIVCVIAVMD